MSIKTKSDAVICLLIINDSEFGPHARVKFKKVFHITDWVGDDPHSASRPDVVSPITIIF